MTTETQQTIRVTRSWQRAIERAQRDSLKLVRQHDGTFRVRSTSRPTAKHIVSLDGAGRIGNCSDCPGWEQGGRQRPCKHAGAVFAGLSFLAGHRLEPEYTGYVGVDAAPTRCGQWLREEVPA